MQRPDRRPDPVRADRCIPWAAQGPIGAHSRPAWACILPGSPGHMVAHRVQRACPACDLCRDLGCIVRDGKQLGVCAKPRATGTLAPELASIK